MSHIADSDVYKSELERVSQYAQTKIDVVLKDMLEKLFVSTPEDPIDFMINYLTDYKEREDRNLGGNGFGVTPPGITNPNPSEGLSVDDELHRSEVVAKRGRRRTAISAEPVQFLANNTYTPVVVQKTVEQQARVRDAVQSNILFSSLERSQLNLIVDTMIEKSFKAGDYIIRQGEQGDFFFVLDSGEAECFVSVDGAEPKKVKDYGRGDSFGELALMYNSPRAATIIAKTDVVCWAVDRITFRRVLMDTTSSARQKYEEFLSQVEILQSLDRYERARMADVLRELSFKDGEYVISQGERGDMFYIIVEGKAKVTKSLMDGAAPVTVLDLGPGDYFGELALINDNPRAANVIASGDLRVVSLDRDSFVRLLGPIDHILKRNQQNYQQVERQIYDEQMDTVRAPDLVLSTTDHPDSKKLSMRRRRTAVSSEPVAAMALGTQQQTPTVPKTEAQIQAIKEAIAGNFLFQGMDEKQHKFVVDAMFETSFKDGEYVIKQGEPGDNFYVLADGTAECFVQKGTDEQPVLVKTYQVGESFGELALMYNSPRAASIRAKGPIRCWAMDRVTFRRVLMDTTSEKRRLYEGFLGDVKLLASLDRYERAKVADAFVEKSYGSGEYVIRQGEPGDNFYIVVSGEAVATKTFDGSDTTKEVMRYKRGDYFGELALLNDKARAANVLVPDESALTVVTLDRSCFVRLLGPCDEILKRNMSNYAAVEAEL